MRQVESHDGSLRYCVFDAHTAHEAIEYVQMQTVFTPDKWDFMAEEQAPGVFYVTIGAPAPKATSRPLMAQLADVLGLPEDCIGFTLVCDLDKAPELTVRRRLVEGGA